jgi:hypothetical protein
MKYKKIFPSSPSRQHHIIKKSNPNVSLKNQSNGDEFPETIPHANLKSTIPITHVDKHLCGSNLSDRGK